MHILTMQPLPIKPLLGKAGLLAAMLLTLVACKTDTLEEFPRDSSRHILAPEQRADVANIPDIVRPLPTVSAPQAEEALDLYSVVVQDVSVRELLFAMARDASINVDVHTNVQGTVSINAIDQTLPQILGRIARQVDIKWSFERSDYLRVEPDLPELRSYRVDYVNIERSADSSVSVATNLDTSTGSATNNSIVTLNQVGSNSFWDTLTSNLFGILGVQNDENSADIIINRESGIVTVRATNHQHAQIQSFLDSVSSRAQAQVLIEATLVEVALNDRNQTGVNWNLLARDGGQISFTQDFSGLNLDAPPTSSLLINKSAGPDAVNATIQMLSQFGDMKVLSSPKIMALNNQTAMLRVVDSRVYFEITVEGGQAATATSPAIAPTYTSEVRTVPVGFTMAVTPQISDDDSVTLNVRPTISRIIRFVEDPSPALAEANVINAVPEIQIREIESILTVESGETAVLGGLMQDVIDEDTTGLPGVTRLPIVSDLLSYKDQNTQKTELIIFIRPIVMKQPSLNGDLQNYGEFLPASYTESDSLQSSAR
ncbi:MAG: type II and III secretion system protein [Pseudohongiella sp.]|nr:MAG: type II and III secretion system protein [Pseudohongiella sp.]